jgi:N-acetylglucosaminyl-diphospho-decaprenol L-rhamnosyltransferase
MANCEGRHHPQSPVPNPQSPVPNPQSPVPNPPPPDFALLLNPDTEIVDDALGRMVRCLLERPQAGACGAQLRYGSGQFQHGAFCFPSLAQVALDVLPLVEVPGFRRFLPRLLNSSLNGRYAQSLWQGTEPFPVDFVLGAALLVRVEAIQQVGVLDDGYFMYCEEMDWCLRLQQAGWTVYAVPSASVIHHEGQSSKQVPWVTVERLWRSRFRFYRKHTERYPRRYVLAVRALVQVGLSTRGWLARRRFARGQISGTALGDELSTYQQILRQG